MHQTGDIILIRTGSLYGESILYFMRVFQRDPIHYSHCLIMIDENYALDTDINKLHIVKINDILKNCKKYKVIRYNEITEEQIKKMYKVAKNLDGLSYSKKRIILQVLDNIFGTNKFTRLLKSKKDQVCSSMVAWIYHTIVKINFNDVEWYSTDPDDIDDESLLNIKKWTTIREKE
jgi:hypothetical protein